MRGDGCCRLPVQWDDALAITGEEIKTLFARMNIGRAPDPDGIIGTCDILVKHWISCFTACLREGVFPSSWKNGAIGAAQEAGEA